jgi:hypothetical protein
MGMGQQDLLNEQRAATFTSTHAKTVAILQTGFYASCWSCRPIALLF